MTFLKWVGGKTQIMETLLEHIPDRIGTYYEPFLGGGSVCFQLLRSDRRIGRFRCFDANRDLINVYKQIQNSPDQLIGELKQLTTTFKKRSDSLKESLYYSIRKIYNDRRSDPIKHAALFIFLNKTCFRGIYRTNRKGDYNVPYGHYKNPTIYDPIVIREYSSLFNDHDIRLNVVISDHLPIIRSDQTILYILIRRIIRSIINHLRLIRIRDLIHRLIPICDV